MTKRTEPWLSSKEAAEHLNISDRTLRKLCKNGKLKYTQMGEGRSLRFRTSWLDAYVLGYGKKLTPTERRELEDLG